MRNVGRIPVVLSDKRVALSESQTMTGEPNWEEKRHRDEIQNVLRHSAAARELAERLWNFLDGKLSYIPNDDQPFNRCHFEGLDVNPVVEIKVTLSIRQDDRREEGLVHELLHANLLRLGFPKFRIYERRDDCELGAEMVNHAEHLVMKDTYLKLGYDDSKFLGIGREPNQEEALAFSELDAIKGELCKAEKYKQLLPRFLKRYSIAAEACRFSRAIIQKIRAENMTSA